MNKSLHPRLMLFISLGFLFLLNSCSSQKPIFEVKNSVFYNHKMELPSSFIQFQINLPYDSIWSKIGLTAGKKVFEIKEGAGADPVEITLSNVPKLTKRGNQLEVTNAILRIKAKPSLAGLNAGWIEGSVKANIQLIINTLDPNSLNFVESKYQYQWMDKPKVNMLGFGVNVAGLVDKYVSSNQDKIKSSLLTKLNESIQPNQWIPAFKSQLSSMRFGSFVPLSSELAIQMSGVKFDDRGLSIQLQVKGLIGLKSSTSEKNFTYELKGQKQNLVYFYAEKEAIEEMLKMAITKEINGSLYKKIRIDSITSKGLKINLEGFLGRKSRANFNVHIGLSDSLVIYKVSELQAEKIGLVYSLFGGNLERKLEKRLNKQGTNLQEMLSKGLGETYKNWVEVEEIRGNPEGLVLVVSYKKSIFEINP